jgi:hypothetical protein
MVGLHGVLIGFSYSLTGFITYGCYFASYGQFQWSKHPNESPRRTLTSARVPSRRPADPNIHPPRGFVLAAFFSALAPE